MSRKVSKILPIGMGIILVLLLLLFYFPKFSWGQEQENIGFLEEWGTESGGISTILPEAFEEGQTIACWTYFQEAEVYLNDEMLYSTAFAERFGKAVPPQWNMVDIPDGSNGQKLSIHLKSPYKNNKIELNEVIFGSSQNIWDWITHKYGIKQITDYILMAIGVVLMMWAWVFSSEKRYKIGHFCFGLMVLLFAIWMRSSMKGIPSYWPNMYINSLMGYLAFFLLPVPLILYLKMRTIREARFTKVCDGMLVADSILIVAVFGIHALGVRDVQESLFIGRLVLIIVTVAAVFMAGYYYINEQSRIYFMTLLNAFLLGIIILFDCLNFRGSDWVVHMGVVFAVALEVIMLNLGIRERDKLQKKTQITNENLQLQLLVGQIRPHFILNTLGGIRSLIHYDARRASDLLYDFSKYVRRNMEQKDYSKQVPFLEELDYIKTYLNLETLRFNDRLHVEYAIEKDDFWILPLTVEPFVENAVKHGLYDKRNGGTVWISSYKRSNNIVIEIRDNGVGFDTTNFWQELDDRKSVGMKSAIYRLEKEMGAKCSIKSSTKAGESGTCVKIVLPEKGGYKQ